MNTKRRMHFCATRRGQTLKRALGLSEVDPIELYKKLRSWDIEAERVMTEYDNGYICLDTIFEYEESVLQKKLEELVGAQNMDKIFQLMKGLGNYPI